MRKVLITGVRGQLGSTLLKLGKEQPDIACIGVDTDNFDLRDSDALESCIVENAIDTIINCAAYTAVNQAESDAGEALAINATAVAAMGGLVKKYGLTWIHISTDYVFDGSADQPYRTTDKPNPINAYGHSKWLGEEAIRKSNTENTIILRTSWLYDDEAANFVSTIFEKSKLNSKLEVVADQIGSPTYSYDLAEAIWTLLPQFRSQGCEIYHYANDGQCSWFEFAEKIVQLSGHDCKVVPKMTMGTVNRPKFSVLDTEKIQKAFDLSIPHWEASLRTCLNKKTMK